MWNRSQIRRLGDCRLASQEIGGDPRVLLGKNASDVRSYRCYFDSAYWWSCFGGSLQFLLQLSVFLFLKLYCGEWVLFVVLFCWFPWTRSFVSLECPVTWIRQSSWPKIWPFLFLEDAIWVARQVVVALILLAFLCLILINFVIRFSILFRFQDFGFISEMCITGNEKVE